MSVEKSAFALKGKYMNLKKNKLNQCFHKNESLLDEGKNLRQSMTGAVASSAECRNTLKGVSPIPIKR